jgi:hypothetical protein
MVRPASRVRQARLTMQALKRVSDAYGPAVEVLIFGARPDDAEFLDLPRDFPWQLAGLLSPAQVAALFNEVDIFASIGNSTGTSCCDSNHQCGVGQACGAAGRLSGRPAVVSSDRPPL